MKIFVSLVLCCRTFLLGIPSRIEAQQQLYFANLLLLILSISSLAKSKYIDQ